MQEHYPHPEMAEVQLPEVLHALSDPLRLRIVAALAAGEERGWGDFEAPVAPSTLSHHMKVLRQAGLVTHRREGTRCIVALRPEMEARFPGLLAAVLRLAPGQSAA
ncbi:metalloregulator ArsR/SmtB family transcription factor [Roseomonas sp. E05]|uniref:ArsR/SmtB family transcription factor n=1 Tax=Roseomonas sp. E05 TaxID=3046310 RepID=UPI0024B97508|nr:metalloregulator ArsR/SmtB family transcription factor [Roseomonas sp. E05]MDJ0387719.1 metalloregulator ArsR/SmtB family transcription factor [Roseomonas sp. E05]